MERYDKLILAPGARPLKPPIPGIDLPGLFTIRTIPDSRLVRQWIDDRKASSAVVVGGGFIGMEMAENLVARGLGVTLVEGAGQVGCCCCGQDRRKLSRLHMAAAGLAADCVSHVMDHD